MKNKLKNTVFSMFILIFLYIFHPKLPKGKSGTRSIETNLLTEHGMTEQNKIVALAEKANDKMNEVTGKMNEATEKATELTKNIWLAGLGAYGKAFDEATERYGKATEDTNKFFTDLVEKGKKLDVISKEKLEEAKEKGNESFSSIEDRIAKVRESMNLSFLNRESKIDHMAAQIDALNSKIDALVKASGGKTAVKRASKASSEAASESK